MGPAKIVARFLDGRTLKGHSTDFDPDRPFFHLTTDSGGIVEVAFSQLKAVFFVKTFKGNPAYVDRKDFSGNEQLAGRKLKIRFRDGEVMAGTTLSYHPSRPGFFLIPADQSGNNDRVYILASTAQFLPN